jgi:hypothetical protein
VPRFKNPKPLTRCRCGAARWNAESLLCLLPGFDFNLTPDALKLGCKVYSHPPASSRTTTPPAAPACTPRTSEQTVSTVSEHQQ